MFGYITPVLSVLSDEQKQRYRSFYCGVCHSLRERHGQAGRLSLSNDMTFLAVLLSYGKLLSELTGLGRLVWCR